MSHESDKCFCSSCMTRTQSRTDQVRRNHFGCMYAKTSGCQAWNLYSEPARTPGGDVKKIHI